LPQEGSTSYSKTSAARYSKPRCKFSRYGPVWHFAAPFQITPLMWRRGVASEIIRW
jgi:hypothetical protein